MANYRADLQDIYFNLFELFNVQEQTELEVADLKAIIEEFNKFVEKEVWPTRLDSDVIGAKLIDGDVKVPDCFKGPQKAFYENGWFALGYPEEIGGMPAPEAVKLACTSLFNGANVAFSMYYGLSMGAMNVILQVGSQEQKDFYVPKMMSGEWGGTMCLTEPGAGSDVGAAKSTAESLGDGKYKIKGNKIFISSGDNDLYENIIHLVLARTPGAPEGTKGLSLFIVPKYKVNSDGTLGELNDVTCPNIEEKMGLHGSATCSLNFGDSGNCEGYLIGNEMEGIKNMFIMMNEARLLCGVQGESQANMVYELTEQYVRERSQFGATIDQLPDVKRQMLRMRSFARAMRSLNIYTANLFDEFHKNKDPKVEAEIALLTPICKSWCSDEGFNVSVDAIQVHGGYGYCSEYGVEQFARDAKIATIYEGTNGIQAIDFLTRKVLKDQGEALHRFGGKIAKTLESLDHKEWEAEVASVLKSLEGAGKLAGHLGEKAQKKQIQSVLAACTPYLNYCGNLVCAWLLLKGAILAKAEFDSASDDRKRYLQSKIDDFRAFCRLGLSRNDGLWREVMGYEADVSSMDV